MTRGVFVWDGKNLPEALKQTPPGRYRIELIDDGGPLTKDEDEGLASALDQLEAGEGIPFAKVLAEVRRDASRP